MDFEQEFHALKMRLDTKTKMEAEYMEEIEELKQVIDGLRQQLEEQRVDSPPEITTDLTLDANRSTVDIVNQINQLQSELELSQKKLHELESENAILRERIDVLEIKESVVLNMTSENATNELLEEIDLLKTQLMAEKSEKQRLHQQIAEKEDDVDAARGQVFELQSTVKSLREELCDVKAEFDGLKLQTGSTDNTRGNSLFSEVEDRRRRAEALVQKQQAFIDKLQHELAYVQAESRRKILHLQQEMESSIVKVDTQLITQLCGEIDRLTKEVSRLDSVQKTSRDQKLSDLRQADQMSTAFRPDHSSQRNLVKALEERLLDYKCKAEKTKQELATLRERFLKETLSRHKLSQELARQRAVTQRLSEELEAADKCYVADSPKISTPRLEDKENLPLDESALNVNKCAQLVSSSDSREVECKQS